MRSVSRLALGYAAAVVLTTACSGGSSPPPGAGTTSTTAQAPQTPATPAPRPTGVPDDATYVELDQSFGGGATAPAEGTPPQLSALSCKDDVLTIVLPGVVELYAALPCDRAASQTVADLFIGRPVTVRVIVAEAEKLRLESPSAGTLEFTIAGAWAKE